MKVEYLNSRDAFTGFSLILFLFSHISAEKEKGEILTLPTLPSLTKQPVGIDGYFSPPCSFQRASN